MTGDQWSRRRAAVDPRRAAELAPHDSDHIVLHAAVVQILDQVGDAAIDLRQLRAKVWKFWPCVSQPPMASVTQPTPASTSRRAVRNCSTPR